MKRFAVFLFIVSILLVGAFLRLKIVRQEDIRKAPHVTAEQLTNAYRASPTAAHRDFTNKLVVVSGLAVGMDQGLFGDGCIRLAGDGAEDVVCDVGGHFGSYRAANTTIVGTCTGMFNHQILMTSCEVVEP